MITFDNEGQEELIKALQAGLRLALHERMDMLCKAGAYGERTLKVAEKSDYWKRTMNDCELIERVLLKVRQE